VKYDVGDQFSDQQGYSNSKGVFELDEGKKAQKAQTDDRPADDTASLRYGSFGGGRGGRGGGGGDRYTPSRPPSGPRAERMSEPDLKRKRVVYEEPE
jgi:hypothetical protein